MMPTTVSGLPSRTFRLLPLPRSRVPPFTTMAGWLDATVWSMVSLSQGEIAAIHRNGWGISSVGERRVRDNHVTGIQREGRRVGVIKSHSPTCSVTAGCNEKLPELTFWSFRSTVMLPLEG